MRPGSSARPRASSASQAAEKPRQRQTDPAAANATSVKPKAKSRPKATKAPAEQQRWCETPELEAEIPRLLQAGRAAEARALLLARAEQGSPITQFFLGVCVGQLEGEAQARASPQRGPERPGLPGQADSLGLSYTPRSACSVARSTRAVVRAARLGGRPTMSFVATFLSSGVRAVRAMPAAAAAPARRAHQPDPWATAARHGGGDRARVRARAGLRGAAASGCRGRVHAGRGAHEEEPAGGGGRGSAG